ncbi:MAG: ABC transporter ATP-binding protein, partial [Eubacteriales bacterium]
MAEVKGVRSLEELRKQYAGASSAGSRKKAGPGGPGGGPGHGPGGPGVRAKGKPKNMRKTVSRLFSYVTKYKLQLVFVLVCMLINTMTSLAGSYVLRPVINTIADTATPAGDRIAYLGYILVIIACIYAVGIVTNYLQARLMLKISQNATEALRRDLFNAVQGLPVRFFDSTPTGETMSRFTNDIDSIDMMINNSLTSIISGTVTLVGTFVMMVYTNIWLTMITILFIPIFAKGGGLIARMSTKYYTGQQEALGAVNGYIEESVSGQKVVKVFNHEAVCEEEFSSLNNDMRDKQFKAQFWGGVMGPIMGNTSQISYALTAGIGGLLCLSG